MTALEMIENAKHNLENHKKHDSFGFLELALEQIDSAIRMMETEDKE